jgi:hypothetical protein
MASRKQQQVVILAEDDAQATLLDSEHLKM